MIGKIFKYGLIIFIITTFSGCTVIFQKGRRSDLQKIENLSRRLDELEEAKRLLEAALSKEIGDKQVKLEMMQKGLVITVLGDVLFDSGKAKIRRESYPILDKVAVVLNKNVPQLDIGIEGHTDNEPIRYSNWKSNWELSSARALSVLHYLVDEKTVGASRVSAIGYGEYRPVASNDTKADRQLNRRVEIVILPQLTKTKESAQAARPGLREPRENLK